MNLPTMYDVPSVVARGGFTEDNLLEEGIRGTFEFLVVVPELGACRVPHVALSHFLAGAEKYEATELPEFYGGAISGDWTIKRERLRILARSFETYDSKLADIGETLERAEAEERKPKVPSHEDLLKAGWVCDEVDPSQIVTSTEVNAGYASTVRASKLQHDYLAEQRRQRQARGLWTICEVAQLFENYSFIPDGENFLKKHLLPAIWNDSLRAVSESDGFKVDGVRVNPLLDCLRPEDVNEWLERERVQFRWKPESLAFEPQLAPVQPVIAAGGDVHSDLPWWQEAHDIFDMAQNIGATLQSQHQKPSNTAIAKRIEARINDIERGKGRERKAPNWDTIRGLLTGWKWREKQTGRAQGVPNVGSWARTKNAPQTRIDALFSNIHAGRRIEANAQRNFF